MTLHDGEEPDVPNTVLSINGRQTLWELIKYLSADGKAEVQHRIDNVYKMTWLVNSDKDIRKWKETWLYLIEALVARANKGSGGTELDEEREEIVRDQMWDNLRGKESRDGKQNYTGGCSDHRLQDK